VRRVPAAAAATTNAAAAGAAATSEDALCSPGFAAARAALLEALAADGLTAAEAPSGSRVLRASYRGITAAAEKQQAEDTPEDEAWVLLSSHDWL